MDEYSYDDIIVNPISDMSLKCIGKEVYYGNTPYDCLIHAKSHSKDYLSVLESIDHNVKYSPFNLRNGDCTDIIILKNDVEELQEPKYVPFSTYEEFIRSYNKAINNAMGSKNFKYSEFKNRLGVWLIHKEENCTLQCIELEDEGIYGVVLRDSHYYVTTWKELMENYCMPDGSPCGGIKNE